MKISFIIPVYNVERYLEECVRSILDQDSRDLEILLVDDGSTDGSPRICDALARDNPCIRVFHTENAGSASARNTGLSHACGEYIGFVDSDDRIVPDSIRRLMRWIEEVGADLCFLEGFKFYPDGRRISFGDGIEPDQVHNQPKEAVCRHLASRSKFAGSACTKLFRRSFLENHGLRFPTGRKHGEDLSLCAAAIALAESYDALDFPYYEYRQQRIGSVTDTFGRQGFWELLLFVEECAGRFTSNREPLDPVCGSLMSFAAYEYSLLVWHYSHLQTADRAEAMEAMKVYSWVMKFAQSRKTKLIALVMKLLGLPMTSRLLALYADHR